MIHYLAQYINLSKGGLFSHLKSNTEKLIPLYNYAVLHAEQNFSDLAEFQHAVVDGVSEAAAAISHGVEELENRTRGCWASLFGCCRGSAENAGERAPLMRQSREKAALQ